MRTLSTVLTLSLSALGTILVSHPAGATEALACPNPDGNWVRVTVQAPESPAVVGQLLGHLRAELAPHKIAVCEGLAAGQPLADIRIAGSGQQVGIEVQIEDAVTEKRTARTLDLQTLPQDAHALTIALGAAELLRASWAEIKLRRDATFKRAVPANVRETVDASIDSPRPRATLALHAAGEEFTRGLHQLGADVSGTLHLYDPLSVTLRLGARQALAVQAPHGSIRANGWLLGAGGLLRLTPSRSTATVAVAAHLDCVRQQFFAEPAPGTSALTPSGTGYLASVGVLGGIALSPTLGLEAEIDGGLVLKGVAARDGEQVVVAMNGPWVGATLGVTFRIW